MNRNFFFGALALGAAAVLWVATGFFGANLLALAMTATIGTVYGIGALELHRFRQASLSLTRALSAIPENLTQLGEWLASVHPSLQNATRLRIEGERVALPGPALTPYLVGLLVMLGMLGTFLGMVVTLNGAVFALEGTADLQAIRSAFSAPIKGLGLAFGTSVAGVASSAMLGLMSAIARRERVQAAQLLDTKIAGALRSFSLSFQRQETFKALQLQSQALPAITDQLQQMVASMHSNSQLWGERMLDNQQSFQREVKEVFTQLADSVSQSLRDSLAQSAETASENIQPMVAAAMSGIAQQATVQHERMVAATQQQLDSISTRFASTANSVTAAWTDALADQKNTSTALTSSLGQSLDAFATSFDQRANALLTAVHQAHGAQQAAQAAGDHQRLDAWTHRLQDLQTALAQEWQQTAERAQQQQQTICSTLAHTAQQISDQTRSSAGQTQEEIARLMASNAELMHARAQSEADWTVQQHARMDAVLAIWRTELAALRDAEALRSQAATEQLGALQTAVTAHLSTLGRALEEPITRLIETASEAPKAAAEVIGKLRQEISSSVARDNELLEERSRIMTTLNALLEAINHASTEQRVVIDSLVASSAQALNQASVQFSATVDAEASKLSDIAASVTSSAVEVSALGETLGFAVNGFGDANEKLIASLQRIEGAMDKSATRSDEQLAYYVAQAREIIDLSITSQKEIVEQLRQLPGQRERATAEAA